VFTCWVPPSGQIRLNPFGYTSVSEQILLSLPLPACVEAPGYEFSREIKPFLITASHAARLGTAPALSAMRQRKPVRRPVLRHYLSVGSESWRRKGVTQCGE
jgi:hypothetical protein